MCQVLLEIITYEAMGFLGGSDDKESDCNAGDLGSILGWEDSPGEENGYLLWYSGLENPMDRGAHWAIVHKVTKSQTRLSNFQLFLWGRLSRCDPIKPFYRWAN